MEMERNKKCRLRGGMRGNMKESYIVENETCAEKLFAFADILYVLRRGKGMTQEQLAEKLFVSAAAVSKWERGISLPEVGMLCATADFFDVSVDELLGRKTGTNGRLVGLNIAMDLLMCAKTAREQGLLALENIIPKFISGNEFLCFLVKLIPELCQIGQITVEGQWIERIHNLLYNYVETLPESERKNGKMIAETLIYILSGEREEIVREVIASHLGMEFRDKLSVFAQYKEQRKEDILATYKDRVIFSSGTNLLEVLADATALQIQMLLRKLDVITLVSALAGASGAVAEKFLENLSDKLLIFVDEDIKHFSGSAEEIVKAQQRVLELAAGLGILAKEE